MEGVRECPERNSRASSSPTYFEQNIGKITLTAASSGHGR